MRLTQIRLRYFKLFKELDLDLKPITLLTGINSSGKSTVLAALAAVLQTSSPKIFPFEIVMNGENCSLGAYKDISYNRTTKNIFAIGFSADHQGKHYSLDASFRYSPRGDHILPSTIECAIEKDTMEIAWDSRRRIYRCQFDLPSLEELKKDKTYRNFLESLSNYIRQRAEESGKKTKSIPKDKLMREFFPDKIHQEFDLRMPASPRQLMERILNRPTGGKLSGELRHFIGEVKKYMSYVGPIRAMPHRYYPPDLPHFDVDPQGSNCAQLLHDWKKHSPSKFKLVAKLLAQLELVQRVRPRSTTDDILKILVQPYSHPEESNFADVGFGVSQALPLIVSDVALPDNSVVMMNQPEVHLHPTSQAMLANYFVSRIDQRQYIIETHSEYIINRLRVLVMKGDIDPEKVLIVFFTPGTKPEEDIKKHMIELKADGSLENAPPEFFQTYYLDSFNLAMGGGSDVE